MKVIEKGYCLSQRCNYCNALLLVEYSDIKKQFDCEGDVIYNYFICPICENENKANYGNKINYPRNVTEPIELGNGYQLVKKYNIK